MLDLEGSGRCREVWTIPFRVWDLQTRACVAVFLASGPVGSVAVSPLVGSIAFGTATGEVIFLEPWGIECGTAILTAANPQQVRCLVARKATIMRNPLSPLAALARGDIPGRVRHPVAQDEDRDVFQCWYRKDENAVPPVFVLQSPKTRQDDS